MKRILLFIITNLAVVILLSIVVHLLGADKFLYKGGINFFKLFVFAFVFGMGGALISLAMSKWIAKMSVSAQVITTPGNSTEKWLIETVRRQTQQAGIGMPEVAIYDSSDVNAFATGMSRDNALVAVSTGLLQGMTQDEVEAVLAHEVSHIVNGDMVTLTLIQGVVNTFVIFLSRLIGFVVDKAISRNQEGVGAAYMIVSLLTEIILGILASVIVFWFSRQREYHADAGSARLAGKQKMIAALQRLEAMHTGQLPDQLAAFGINSSKLSGLKQFFATHPPLEDRIAALQEGRLLK